MDFSDLVVLSAVVLIVLVIWRFVRRRGQQQDQDFSPEQQRLQDARNISDVFRGITVRPIVSVVVGHVSFKVPEPEASITDDEIARLNGFAEAMADAEEESALQAQIAAEALRGGEAIIASEKQTVRNHGLVERNKAALYGLFGQEAPPTRSEDELLTETAHLEADMRELEDAMGGTT